MLKYKKQVATLVAAVSLSSGLAASSVEAGNIISNGSARKHRMSAEKQVISSLLAKVRYELVAVAQQQEAEEAKAKGEKAYEVYKWQLKMNKAICNNSANNNNNNNNH